MFNPLMLLAAEANAVIVLRMMKLMRGGRSARRRPSAASIRSELSGDRNEASAVSTMSA